MLSSQQFRILVSSYHRRLFRCAIHLLGNTNDAEDAVQDTYLKLWNMRDSLDEVENIEAYCISSLRHICFDRLRANKLDTNTDIDDISETFAPATHEEQAMEARDELEHLRKAIDNLPPPQRLAVTMRDIEDCSMEEIEAASGFTQTNIRSLLCRGRKSIREQFAKLT